MVCACLWVMLPTNPWEPWPLALRGQEESRAPQISGVGGAGRVELPLLSHRQLQLYRVPSRLGSGACGAAMQVWGPP